MGWIPLATTEAIPNATAQEFNIEHNGKSVELFVIHVNNRYYAYSNHCPHTGVNLNWMPDQFFDLNNEFIQCSTHGALFRFDDGYCVRGPCAGASLQSLPLRIHNNEIHVQID
ncbi:MAG: Rieske 2Fe-2S domain-containing protein [Gammaproteobacteria bacterium]|jgi:nitrite reductase/ring-hydroxylating ferredoxin subunit